MRGNTSRIGMGWRIGLPTFALGWILAAAGCGGGSTSPPDDGDDTQLEEGEIVDRTVYTFRSPSAFDPPEVSQVPHQVVNGQLVPLDEVGQEAPPMGEIRVTEYAPGPTRARGSATAQQGSSMMTEELMAMDDVPRGPKTLEFLRSAPEGARATTRTNVHVTQRLAAVDYLSDLGIHGVAFQYREVTPPPTGAVEVVEIVLDGKIRGAIEQFDDPAALTAWYKANVQMMQDLGMNPDEHMVMRGLTLVRVGKGGHVGAMERARSTPLVDEGLGYLAVARQAARDAQSAAPVDTADAHLPNGLLYSLEDLALVPMDEQLIQVQSNDGTPVEFLH